ncbi:hypothetical protein TeGR_g8940, partial [Tetraparma gracilis]
MEVLFRSYLQGLVCQSQGSGGPFTLPAGDLGGGGFFVRSGEEVTTGTIIEAMDGMTGEVLELLGRAGDAGGKALPAAAAALDKRTLEALAKLPALLLSDVLAALPLPVLLPLIPTLLSARTARAITAAPLYPATKFPLLALSNSLLGRLSRPLHTPEIGRVLSFLARAIPLTDKAGVNLKGNFSDREVAAPAEGGDDASDDAAAKFWSVLPYLSTRDLITSDPGGWRAAFSACMTALETHAWSPPDAFTLRSSHSLSKASPPPP